MIKNKLLDSVIDKLSGSLTQAQLYELRKRSNKSFETMRLWSYHVRKKGLSRLVRNCLIVLFLQNEFRVVLIKLSIITVIQFVLGL